MSTMRDRDRLAAFPAPAFAKAMKEAFGEHPEDVVAAVRSAAEVLGWLEALFSCIAESADDPRRSSRVRELSNLGEYVASDFSSCFDCRHESMAEALLKAGLINRQAQQDGHGG